MLYFVYELVDPRNNATGYVGITNNPNKRYLEHIEERGGKGKKYEWIKRLQGEQAQPKMKILEIVDDLAQARRLERYWVQYYLKKGISLVNTHLINSTSETIMGRSVAPKGFYTAAQAIKKTGMPKSTFNDMVKKGKITRIVPPNRSDGFYPREEIDRLAKAHEAFILEYALDTSTFELSQEDDLEDLAALYRELFGGNRESRERLIQEWYDVNPEMFYVVKQDGLVVGYIAFMPLKQEAIEKIMAGLEETRFRTELLTPEYIAQFRPGEADSLFVLIGVKQGVKKTRLYGSRAITGGIEALESLAKRGVVTQKLYATSRTQGGIRICKSMGFKQITPAKEEDNLLRFELDLETTTNPLFKDYQRFAKQAKAD